MLLASRVACVQRRFHPEHNMFKKAEVLSSKTLLASPLEL